jgi:lysozyme
MPTLNNLKSRIKRHEGKRERPYEDSEGILTVGYGRNLEAVPFSQDELDLMFDNDFRRAQDGAEGFFCYSQLNDVRRGVLIEMVFQMGVKGVSKFKRFLDAALTENWQMAHDEMLDSKWAKQTPSRAKELAEVFLRGIA